MRILLVGFALALVPALSPAQDAFFDSNGVPIRYVDKGAGTPIVLVHGYTRSLELEFMDTGVLQNLAADHRVIAFDLRGHGRSGKPHEPSAYGEQMVQDIVRLLDHLQVRRTHIVGYSLGAAIVAKVITTHPERFITATLGGAAGARSWSEEQATAAERAAVELESGTPFRSVILATAPADEPAPSEDEILRRSREMVATNDPLAMAAYNRRRDELVVTPEKMAALRIPVLGIIGSADANLANLRDLQRTLPSLELVVIEGATHGGPRRAHGRVEFVDAVRRFVTAHEGSLAER